MPEIADLLQQFLPISLAEMQTVKLMNRIDTKYLVSIDSLPRILAALKGQYFVQEVAGTRIAHYNTLYYDTADVKMYLAHHDRKLTRQKLRARIYVDTHQAFCEIKNKNNKKRTKKKRVELNIDDFGNMLQNSEIENFVEQHLRYSVHDLSPQLENFFSRITLVNVQKTERLTIDLLISFHNRATGVDAEIPHLVIIELKQDGNADSYFKTLLRDMRIKPKRISKYCLGTILTRPGVKANRFKRKLRYIEKLNSNN